MYQEHARYTERTVEWGHWGITFMAPQPDKSKNYGEIVAHLDFPVGTRGPCDLMRRDEYRAMCAAWVSDGCLPALARAAQGGK